tara:strand:+ start:139 stop:792 length:654 start_codon:yes stop_codon:yes gene_type:complete
MEVITRAEAKRRGYREYFTGVPCVNGHIVCIPVNKVKCPVCMLDSMKANEYQAQKTRDYRRDKVLSSKSFDAAITQSLMAEYHKGKDKKDYARKKSKESITRKKRRLKAVLYNKNNPVSSFVRRSLCRINSNYSGTRAKGESECGYTAGQLKNHIEGQFTNGMAWDNRNEWHIDHIKPVSAFIKEGITDPAIINALSNLQPLWAKDNLSKGAKYNEM